VRSTITHSGPRFQAQPRLKPEVKEIVYGSAITVLFFDFERKFDCRAYSQSQDTIDVHPLLFNRQPLGHRHKNRPVPYQRHRCALLNKQYAASIDAGTRYSHQQEEECSTSPEWAGLKPDGSNTKRKLHHGLLRGGPRLASRGQNAKQTAAAAGSQATASTRQTALRQYTITR